MIHCIVEGDWDDLMDMGLTT